VAGLATYIQNKQDKVPEDWVGDVKGALRKIGYRLVLRELRHPRVVTLGSSFPITMTWENVGVAPPYVDYVLKVRLKQGNTKWVSPPLLSIKGWLPGERVENVAISLPQVLPAGDLVSLARRRSMSTPIGFPGPMGRHLPGVQHHLECRFASGRGDDNPGAGELQRRDSADVGGHQ